MPVSEPRPTRPLETGERDSVGRKAVHVLAVAGGSAGRWFTRSTRAEGADASGLASLIDLHAVRAGNRLFAMTPEQVRSPFGVEVVQVTPSTIALALALGAKPTTLIALVPIFFWSVRARRQTVIAAVAAALFVVPFAFATGLSQFYYNVLGVQLDVFPRFNALTIDTFLKTFSLPILPFAGSAIVVAAATILVLRRRPSTYGDLLTGTAILATVSFLVAKWAYFNYYYIPAVLLVLAIAGDSLPLDVPEMIRPPALFLRSVDWLRAAAGRFPRGSSVPGISFPGRQ